MELGKGQFFCHNFQKDVMDSFRSLRERSEGFDVILGCSSPDSTNIICMQAHKMLIAASSPLLGNILESSDKLEHPASPFLYLGEISQRDLNYILTFIYNGEVQVPTEDISSFSSTAQQLQIRGIAKIYPEEQPMIVSRPFPGGPQNISNIGDVMSNVSFNPPIQNGFGFQNGFGKWENVAMPSIKTEPKLQKKPKLEKPLKIKKELNKSGNPSAKNGKTLGEKTPVGEQFKQLSIDQYKEWKGKFSSSDGEVYYCFQCAEKKSFTAASSLMRHYKTSHEITCKCCKMPFYDENIMQEHYKANHEFPCGLCDKVFTAKSSADRHHKTAHSSGI